MHEGKNEDQEDRASIKPSPADIQKVDEDERIDSSDDVLYDEVEDGEQQEATGHNLEIESEVLEVG